MVAILSQARARVCAFMVFPIPQDRGFSDQAALGRDAQRQCAAISIALRLTGVSSSRGARASAHDDRGSAQRSRSGVASKV